MPNRFRFASLAFAFSLGLGAFTLVQAQAEAQVVSATPSSVVAPLTLEAAIKEGLSQSEEAKILREKKKKFEALKREAWSSAYPQIVANANAGRGASVIDPSVFGFQPADSYVKDADGNLVVDPITGKVMVDRTPSTGGGPAVIDIVQNRFAWDIGFQQSLFSFGRLSQVVKVANIQDNAEAASRKRSTQQLQLQILDGYYALVNARAALQTLEASLSRSQETYAFLESNFKMGSGLRSNALRALTQLKSLEPERIRAKRAVEGSRMLLNRLLGRDIYAPLELDTSAHLEIPLMAQVPDSAALQEIINDRPDLKSMELSRQSMQGQAKYLRMLYLPSLGAQGKYGITAFKLRQLSDIEKNHEWSLGVGLTWPLFDGFNLASKAQQMESEARSLSLTTQQLRKVTQVEIGGAYMEFRATDSARVAAEQAVEAAQEAQAMVSEEFRAGKGQLTDLLDAEQSLREASLGVLNARYASVRSRAALSLALGKGLINEEAP